MRLREMLTVYGKVGSGDMAIYNSQGETTTSAYLGTGDRVVGTVYASDGDPVEIIDSAPYSDPTISTLFTLSLFPMQAFAVHNGIMFQFKAGGSAAVKDVMDVINISAGSKIATDVPITSGHGNSACFSGEYYDQNDAYPLLYVTDHDIPDMALIYVNRVTTNSAQLVKTYKFPFDRTGYYGQAVVDSANEIIYMVGTSKMNLTTAGSDSKTIISKWDYSNPTYNESDGTYTPAFVSALETDFFAIHQGITLFDGYVWIVSWDYINNANYLAVINPTTGAVVQIIDLNISEECEGIAFISENEAIVGVQGGTYKKLAFD